MNANDLGNDAADLGRGVELSFTLAALSREVPHKIFIGIAQNVIAFGSVLGKIERLVFKDGDQIGEPLHHLLAGAKLVGVVEVRHVGQLVGIGERSDNLFIDLVAYVALALERNHILEACPFWNRDRRVGNASVFVADIFDEQQYKDVVLVLAGIHAAAQFIAASLPLLES